MIICGDFFQLAPIGDEDPHTLQRDPKYAFDSEVWKQIIPRKNMFSLAKVFRQERVDFVQTLERIRRGIPCWQDIVNMTKLDRPLNFADGVEPISL
jgi:ATP-dependent DNA helicase PIF1